MVLKYGTLKFICNPTVVMPLFLFLMMVVQLVQWLRRQANCNVLPMKQNKIAHNHSLPVNPIVHCLYFDFIFLETSRIIPLTDKLIVITNV